MYEPPFDPTDKITATALDIAEMVGPVSYTHLTLPTNREVQISGAAVSLKKKHQTKKRGRAGR